MSLKILSSQASMDSAMKLRDAIQTLLGMESKTILVSKSSTNCKTDTVIMRYGCGYGNLPNEPECSSRQFFETSIDKYRFSKYFEGIVAVPVFEQNKVPTEFPVLIREVLNGKASEGIHVVHSIEEFNTIWKPEYWWVKYYEHNIEIRVYVALSDKEFSLRVYKKVPREMVTSSDDFVCGLNGEDNTKWVLKDSLLYPQAIKDVKRMLPKIYELGGRFAAFDMIWSIEERRYITLEMNSGPWLSKPCAEWLARFFVEHQPQYFQKGE